MEDILRRMERIPQNFQMELGHLEADQLLCEAMRRLATTAKDKGDAERVIEAWGRLKKPYGTFTIQGA